ncbi:hypothetical protein F4821DRAFT_255276 [Hypoxylon rubiginosum]|uniref:Uncharacterized protein n=1 Tax=Hypoxylon rubiginosum TaxID=110542 RepID=A0ACC0DEF1_9PEZI|nr:hypothetical protein F4821DRAFT_255276 [Hypoxylon rubiginosum]
MSVGRKHVRIFGVLLDATAAGAVYRRGRPRRSDHDLDANASKTYRVCKACVVPLPPLQPVYQEEADLFGLVQNTYSLHDAEPKNSLTARLGIQIQHKSGRSLLTPGFFVLGLAFMRPERFTATEALIREIFFRMQTHYARRY